MKKIVFLFVCALSLAGCVQKAVHLARETPGMVDRGVIYKNAMDGDVEAQYDLGTNYCCGPGILHDTPQALYWWCQAGRQGQKDALYQIGTLFENTRRIVGSEVPVDPAKAYAYYSLAEKRHSQEGAAARARLEKTLSPEDRSKADEIIRFWPNMECELPSTLPKPDPLLIPDDKRRGTI